MEINGLVFRGVEPEDVDLLFRIENDWSNWFASETEAPLTRHLLLQYALSYQASPFEEGQLRLIVEEQPGKPIGIADFYELSRRHSHSYVGIYLIPEKRDNGFGAKIIEGLIYYARNYLQLKQLMARIASFNEAALRCFESCGFVKAGYLKQWYQLPSGMADIVLLQYSVKDE